MKSSKNGPFLSIIIPTYNEENYIESCLKSLYEQSYRNFEIIIVDDGSSDKTREIAGKFKVMLIEGKHKGPGISRNLGAKKANGEIFIFVDADMTFDKDYLKNLISPLLKYKKEIGATHGYEIAKNTQNIWSHLWGKIRVTADKRIKHSPEMVLFRAIRKRNFLKMGGFDPKYGYADDQTFWLKFKVTPIIAHNAICYHRNAETLKEVYKQSRWIGSSFDKPLFRTPFIKYIIPFLLIIISPFAIPILSFKRARKNKSWKLFFPWMFIFMTVRYMGTVSGVAQRIYFKKNIR